VGLKVIKMPICRTRNKHGQQEDATADARTRRGTGRGQRGMWRALTSAAFQRDPGRPITGRRIADIR
jgi:hypothetical protein